MKTIALALGIALVSLLAGCATTPEQRAAREKAWAEHDRVRAAECAHMGMIFMSGSCVPRDCLPGSG
jgi:hypothetical protein